MKIGNAIRNTLVGTAAMFATACSSGHAGQLTKMANPPRDFKQVVNLVNRPAKEVLADSTYKLFGRDTLKLTDDYGAFAKNLAKKLKTSIPKVLTGTEKLNSNMSGPTVNKYTDYFIDSKAVVKKEFYKDVNNNTFVPVEYYGRKNPDPALKDLGLE